MTETGMTINLSENSYRFLLLLLQGETDKQNIINQVWHEQRGSVSDSSYYGQIYMLRKALNVAGLPTSLIKTIPRKGVKYMGKFNKEVDSDSDSETGSGTEYDNDISGEAMRFLESVDADGRASPAVSNPNSEGGRAEWYNSRRWNMLISVLAVLAVCWLTTLVVMVLILLQQ